MKIIHIGKFYPPYRGGMESYLSDLAQAQVKQGHQVTVIVHNHNWEGLTSDTFEVDDQGVTIIRLKSLRSVFHTPIMFGLNRCIKRLIKQDKADLLHIHGPNPSLFWLLFNQKAKVLPWVLSWHSDMVTKNSSVWMKLIYFFIKPLESRLIKHSSQILVSTQYYANASEQLVRHASKVNVIPLGINCDNLEKTDTEIKPDKEFWHAGDFRLFSLGRLTFYKNQRLLIAAMRELQQCHLIVAGGGLLARALNQQIAENGIADKVSLLGEVSSPVAQYLFSSCDVFCLASHDRAESFGVVLLEAMYHNKIILVADTEGSGMKWLAENYNKGFTFISNDVEDYCQKIKHIRENYEEIMARPYQFDYDIDTIAQAIEQNSYTQISS